MLAENKPTNRPNNHSRISRGRCHRCGHRPGQARPRSWPTALRRPPRNIPGTPSAKFSSWRLSCGAALRVGIERENTCPIDCQLVGIAQRKQFPFCKLYRDLILPAQGHSCLVLTLPFHTKSNPILAVFIPYFAQIVLISQAGMRHTSFVLR